MACVLVQLLGVFWKNLDDLELTSFKVVATIKQAVCFCYGKWKHTVHPNGVKLTIFRQAQSTAHAIDI